MDGGMSGMGGGGGSGTTTLTSQGVDFSNDTDASNFLAELLDDTTLQVFGNTYARYFWYGTVTFIGLAAVVNLFRAQTLRYRIRQAALGEATPARPKNLFMRIAATATAMGREASYMQLTPTKYQLLFKVPPMGNILVILAYFGFVMALEFVDNDMSGAQHYEALGVRAAWLAIAQVPLLILMIGKYNWVGFVTGIGYEKLNVYHRWVSRMLLLLATFHFAFQARGWDQFPGIFDLEWSTDICVPTGLATYVILLWLNLSTLAPFRNLSYEFFVAQHIITFFGFIIALMIHLPTTALYSRVYIYIPIGLYLFDRLIRFVRFTYMNLKTCSATLEAVDNNITRVVLHNHRLGKWKPGAHILVNFPALGFAQSHPATILSRPDSHGGDVVLLLKARKGLTKRLVEKASNSVKAPSNMSTKSDRTEDVESQTCTLRALAEGPFGGSSSDFAAFASVCFIAGSTGITFILALLLDLASRAEASNGKLPLRRVYVAWSIRNTAGVDAVLSELSTAVQKLSRSGIEVDISIFITCADDGADDSEKKECDCNCSTELSSEPCCCVSTNVAWERRAINTLTKNCVKEDSESGSEGSLDTSKKLEITTLPVQSSSDVSPARVRAVVESVRPTCRDIIERTLIASSDGETGVAVCGPFSMSVDVRNAVAVLSDQRAVHKGTGAQGIYLHVEGFSQ